MVRLVFDATAVAPADTPPGPSAAGDMEVHVTLGASKVTQAWTGLRTMTFRTFAQTYLSEAPVGIKDGSCYVPGKIDGTRRVKDRMAVINMVVLDSDSGHTLEECAAALTRAGYEGVIHSTFSHLTDKTAVSAKHYDKWRAEHGDDPVAYLRAHKGYLPRVAEGAVVVDEEAGNYIIAHRPCPKYRIVVPLETPWVGTPDDVNAQHLANARWRNRIEALAHHLGLHHDQSCTDTSRLFYTPRRPSEAVPFEYRYITGRAAPIDTLPDAPPPEDAAGLFAQAPRPAGAPPPARPRAVESGDVIGVDAAGMKVNLTHWAASHAGRFEISSALRARRPDVFGRRRSGVKHHIECPYDEEHTQAGDRTGSYVVNASEIGRAGMPTVTDGFYVKCSHNACVSRDRLQMLKGMLAKGWLAVPDLTNPDFLVMEAHDLAPVDTSKLLAKLYGDQDAEDGQPEERPGNIPMSCMMGLPRTMADFMDYTLRGAVKPQPILALGAMLSMMGAVLGRKVQLDGWGTRPNLYIAGIAHSGAGKERPLTAVKNVLRATGTIEKYLGPEDVASDAGVVASLRDDDIKRNGAVVGRRGCSRVMLLDEIGFLLQAMTDRAAGVHLKQVVPTLLRLYSKSDTVFSSKSYADTARNFTIDQPNLCMFGVSTPDKLYGALTSTNISDGLLSRTLVFDAGDHDPAGGKPEKLDPPASVLEWVRAWDAAPLNSNPLAMEGGEPAISPRGVITTPEADAIIDAFSAEMEARKKAARDEGFGPLFVRARENALKFALIRACADGPDGAMTVNSAVAQWAVDLSRAATEHMVTIARDHVVDNQFQKWLADFGSVIRKQGKRGVTTKELMRRKACQLPPKDFQAVLEHLMNSGEVSYLNTNAGRTSAAGNPVKARNAYVWTAGLTDDDTDE